MLTTDNPAPFYSECYFAEFDEQTYGEAERAKRRRKRRKLK